jgi:allantoinase
MSAPDLVIRSRRVAGPAGIGPASVHIRNGRIDRVGEFDDVPEGGPILDAGNSVVMPGVVDSHVHINEPGRTEWEGFETATRAAAAGGVTTLVDMPLEQHPADHLGQNLLTKAEAAEGRLWVDVGLWGGAVSGNAKELRPMIAEGALGFKCFLIESGVPEFSHVTAAELEEAMLELRGSAAPLLVHAELPGPIEEVKRELEDADPASYSTYVRSRPKSAEDRAIELLYTLCRSIRAATHVVHLSSSGALETMRRAMDEGLPMTAETTPHYLHFEAETVPRGRRNTSARRPSASARTARPSGRPSARGSSNGGLGPLALPSLHEAPRRRPLRRGLGRISSLELALPVTWTEAKSRGRSLEDLVEWMCRAPARLAGLDRRKGSIAPGLTLISRCGARRRPSRWTRRASTTGTSSRPMRARCSTARSK